MKVVGLFINQIMIILSQRVYFRQTIIILVNENHLYLLKTLSL